MSGGLLLLGGSFNPVHWGHLLLTEEILEEFGFDAVLLIPALRSPFKEGIDDPGGEHRLAMLKLACAGNPRLEVDDRELKRGGPSYTIDTVRSLREERGLTERPGLLVGDDLVEGFSAWREAEALKREARIIVARRLAGQVPSHSFERATNRLIPISSSEIRERLANGRSVRYLLPEAVLDYIRDNGLYGSR